MALAVGDHTVSGTLSGVEPKTNGWFRFSILQAGNQYPDKVDTSKQEIINAATALLGQQVTAQVTVQDSGNANPHRPGENYLNRYLNAIGPAAMGAPVAQQPQQAAAPPQQAAPQPQAPAQPQAWQQDPFTPDARDLKIYRQVAWKTSVELAAAGMIEFDTITLVQAAEVAMGYLRYGPARFGVQSHEVPVTPQQAAGTSPQPMADPGPQAPHPADDDIPF